MSDIRADNQLEECRDAAEDGGERCCGPWDAQVLRLRTKLPGVGAPDAAVEPPYTVQQRPGQPPFFSAVATSVFAWLHAWNLPSRHPRTFSGLTFGDLIRFLYDKASLIPLAMLTDDGVRFMDMEFKLGATADPNLCCKVYAIAKGLNAVEGVMKIPPEQILSYRKGMRRKVKSMSSNSLLEMKKIKPALGNEIEQIRESIMNMYAVAEDYDVEAAIGMAEREHNGYPNSDQPLDGEVSEYERFVPLGVPEDVADHIVVCGFPSDTYHFIKTIREAPMPDDYTPSPAIVFLASIQLTSASTSVCEGSSTFILCKVRL